MCVCMYVYTCVLYVLFLFHLKYNLNILQNKTRVLQCKVVKENTEVKLYRGVYFAMCRQLLIYCERNAATLYHYFISRDQNGPLGCTVQM